MKRSKIINLLALTMLILGFALGAWAQEKAQDFCHQGQQLMAAGQYLPAAEAYKEALRLQPELESAHLGLIRAYGGLTYLMQRHEAHRLLHELAPDDAVGHYGLGLLYVQKRDLGYAQDECQILQKLDPALAQRLDQAIFQRK